MLRISTTRKRKPIRKRFSATESLETRILLAADAFEPNESLETAAEIYTGDLVISGLSIDPVQDSDWFRWIAPEDGTLNMQIEFSHAAGDLDMRLFNSQQHFLKEGNSSDDNETIVENVIEGNTYFIWVFGYELATNDYTLTIDGPGNPGDAYEPNDSMETAFQLGNGDQSIGGLSIHGLGTSNDDWFSWTASADGTATVDLTFQHRLGDVDLAVHNASGSLGTSTSSDDNEQVSFTAVKGQQYWVHAYGYNGATNPVYSLDIDGPEILPDSYEPNDTAAMAYSLSSDDLTYSDLNIHEANNSDWFSWKPKASGSATIEIFFPHTDGDLDMELYDGATRIHFADSVTDNESIAFDADASKTYDIRVYGVGGTTHGGYQLRIDGTDILPDTYEPNNSAESAATLPAGDGTYSGLTIHEFENEDWYHWTPSTFGQVTIDVNFFHALGDVDLAVFTGDIMIASSTSRSDNESVTLDVSAGQTLGIQVYGHAGALQSDYELRIDGPEFTPIFPDSMEPNSTFQDAISIGHGPQIHSGLNLHEPDDEDWFHWTAMNSGLSEVSVEFDPDSGILGLELLDANQNPVATGETNGGTGKIEWDAVADEPYYLRVFSVDAIRPLYDVQIKGPTSSDNFAVLFSGGGGKRDNHKRYYDSTKDLYETLTNKLGVNPNNIYVLFGDGTNTAIDRSDNKNSDLSFARHILPATPANLETVLTQTLPPLVDGNDNFFFWSFDHGGGNHLDTRYGGYRKNAKSITGEEDLTGWTSSVSDEDLKTWTDSIRAERETYVFTQCFAGGMLDNFLPAPKNVFGMAATNHYEFSYDDTFAAAFNKALNKGHTKTLDAYKYAHDNDRWAKKRGTYTNNTGDYKWGVEHPWATSTNNFPIFRRFQNAPPSIFDNPFALKTRGQGIDLMIDVDLLRGAAEVSDLDGDAVKFRVESVLAGELLLDGQPIVPGESIVDFDSELEWTAPANANGVVNAFSVRAYDGSTISTQSAVVKVQIGEGDSQVHAEPDSLSVEEDAINVQLDLLSNDDGEGNLHIVGVGVARHGDVVVENGQILYTPAADFVGEDHFTYFIMDSTGQTDYATATVNISATNDAPIAHHDEFFVAQDSSRFVVDVLRNDLDPELETLMAVATSLPSNGDLIEPQAMLQASPWTGGLVDREPGSFIYTPRPGFTGVDQFTYFATDGHANSAEVTVTIHVVAGEEVRVDIVNVTPTSRSEPVDEIDFIFNQAVSEFTEAHLRLERSHDEVEPLLLQATTLATQDGVTWTLSGLHELTSDSGVYDLSLELAEPIYGALNLELNQGDSIRWIQGAGDANRDGVFGTGDLIQVFAIGQFEDGIPQNSTWSSGDWNGDGDFDTGDLIAAFQAGTFSRTAVMLDSPGFDLDGIQVAFADDQPIQGDSPEFQLDEVEEKSQQPMQAMVDTVFENVFRHNDDENRTSLDDDAAIDDLFLV